MRPIKNREAIIEASLKLFCEKGFYDASIKEITFLAGVSPGNIYNHFKSKEELFEYIFQQYFPGNHVELLVEGITSDKSPDENIGTALNNIINYAENNQYFFKLLLIDADEFGGRLLKKYSEYFIKPIEEYLGVDAARHLELRKDIRSIDITSLLSWLFYSIGITSVIYRDDSAEGRMTPIYETLLKILQKGLKG